MCSIIVCFQMDIQIDHYKEIYNDKDNITSLCMTVQSVLKASKPPQWHIIKLLVM